MLSRQIIIEHTQELKVGNGLNYLDEIKPTFVFVFGCVEFFLDDEFVSLLKNKFKDSIIVGASSAGEISKKGVSENSMVLTAVKLEKSKSLFLCEEKIDDDTPSKINKFFKNKKMKNLLCLSSGIKTPIEKIIKKINILSNNSYNIFGGIAGDHYAFKQNYILFNGKVLEEGVVFIGFDSKVQISGEASGGHTWKEVKSDCDLLVTKAIGKRLYEVNNISVVDVYKKLLKGYSSSLPMSGLLFPFDIKNKNGVLRAVLSIEKDCLILGGDVEEGDVLHVKKGSISSLVADVEKVTDVEKDNYDLCFVFSCVARKMIMGNHEIQKEFDVIKRKVQSKKFIGFYSYGEICYFNKIEKVKADCLVHNQTIALIVLKEILE